MFYQHVSSWLGYNRVEYQPITDCFLFPFMPTPQWTILAIMTKTPDDVTAAIQKLDTSDQGKTVIKYSYKSTSTNRISLSLYSPDPNIYSQTQIDHQGLGRASWWGWWWACSLPWGRKVYWNSWPRVSNSDCSCSGDAAALAGLLGLSNFFGSHKLLIIHFCRHDHHTEEAACCEHSHKHGHKHEHEHEHEHSVSSFLWDHPLENE